MQKQKLNANSVGVNAHIDPHSKGITLIALIITIIVMLILVGVTIAVSLNGGLFSKAKQAKTDTQTAIDEEQKLASGQIEIDGVWYDSMEDYLNNKPLIELPEGIKVGDYVNYTPDEGTYKVSGGSDGTGSGAQQDFTTETLTWRILSIDEENGKIELVSDTLGKSITFSGADGYNHCVDILNDLCNTLYSKTKDGKKVAIGRSINVEDINAKTTYDYTTFSDYGTEYKYSAYGTSNRKYPNLYAREDGFYVGGEKQTGGISGSIGLKDGVVNTEGVTEYKTLTGYTDDNTDNKDISVTYTNYNYKPESYLKDLGINTAPTGLINKGTTYWLASRCVYAYSRCVVFALRCVDSGGEVLSNSLFYSTGHMGIPSYAVRPVVSLESNFSLTKDEEHSTDSVTYWNINF